MPLEKTKNIILTYQGHLDFEAIGNLIGKLQQIMKDMGERVNVYKKILTVMIESLENAYKYSKDIDLTDVPAKHRDTRFILSYEEGVYMLQVANPVLAKDIERIINRLDYINNLDQTGLKELYKNTITDGKFNVKGGAGLGFIEMAKLAHDKLTYRFEDINSTYKNFILTICIN